MYPFFQKKGNVFFVVCRRERSYLDIFLVLRLHNKTAIPLRQHTSCLRPSCVGGSAPATHFGLRPP